MVVPAPSDPLPYREASPYAAASWLAVNPPVLAADGHDPGPTAGTTAGAGSDPFPPVVAGSRWSAGTSWGWGVATVESPTTPVTREASEAGTAGCSGANRATRPSARRADTSETSKARSIWAVVPVTGMSNPSGEVVPGRSPADETQARAEAMVSDVGPKVEANRPAPR